MAAMSLSFVAHGIATTRQKKSCLAMTSGKNKEHDSIAA